MGRRLPPLNAVRAFEAAGRHRSFLRAADELGVTPGAVSYQVKLLEGFLGLRLFRRLPRGVVPTEAGAALLVKTRDSLDRLAAATDELGAGHRSRVLRISALPALAEKWLVPRLKHFQEQHPEIHVRLAAEAEIVDFVARDVDVGLRYTDGHHPELRVDRLMAEEIFPVCSPSLLRGGRALKKPEDVARHTLLYDDHWQDEWRLWLEAAGLRDLPLGRGQHFTLYSMALEAAIKGGGIAMGHAALVADDLAARRLVAPFKLKLAAPCAYYLVSPRWRESRAAVVAFRNWLLAEVARSGSSARSQRGRTLKSASRAKSRDARRP